MNEPDNAFVRAQRQRNREETLGEQARLERELWIARQTIAEDRAALAQHRDEAAMVASQRRDRLRELARELQVLEAAEQDLAAARAREPAIAAELQPLRVAELELQDQQKKLAALREQAAALAPAIATAQAEYDQLAAQLQPKLVELQARVAKARELNLAVDAAIAAVAALGAGLAPPPPPPPPAPEPARK